MNKRFLLAMAGVMALTFFSCSKDNDELTTEEQEALDASINESLKTQAIMKALCRVDTLDNGKLSYTPRIGKAIESTTPTVYYSIGYDLEYSRQTFESIVSPVNSDWGQRLSLDEVRQGNIHLKFSESNKPGELARITVDCPDLRDVLTEIVFVTEERWPTNDQASPFNYLSIWRYGGRIYVCVRTATSESGSMLTFDGGWKDDWFTTYTHWQGEFYLFENTASARAIQNLAYALRNHNDLFTDMFNAMNERVQNPHWLWGSLYNGVWQRFDHDYTYKHGLWCAYNCYYVHLKKSSINRNAYQVGKYNYSDETLYYEHKDTPKRDSPSYEILFDPGFNKNGWECIYKGT